MEDVGSSKRRANEELPLLTPPTPRVNSFSQPSNLDSESTTLSQIQTHSSATTSGVTPPSTASPLKRPRDSTSPERQELNHNGIAAFITADPPVTDLLAAHSSSLHQLPKRQNSSEPSLPSPASNSKTSGYQNNTIVNTIRELGYRKYLQTVTPPHFLPARLQATPVSPDTGAAVTKSAQRKKKSAPVQTQSQTQTQVAVRSSRLLSQGQSKKRKVSEADLEPASKFSPIKTRKSEGHRIQEAREQLSKQPKAATPPVTTNKPSNPKSKSRKFPKKTTNPGTSKPEKSRTKEQRWGDLLKTIVGGEKDVYQKLPGLAVPPIGTLIEENPVRPYAFNKGKVQDYGDSEGLHPREMELAREVGLSYDAYRQQKRMAFIGYAAMQLEGKKEFKKSHTQSMCNIDGNKATHLWTHFHDCWGWMPDNPSPPITIAGLGGIQLPDLHLAQPQ